MADRIECPLCKYPIASFRNFAVHMHNKHRAYVNDKEAIQVMDKVVQRRYVSTPELRGFYILLTKIGRQL